MKKTRNILALTLLSVFLGMILSIQFKTISKSVGEGVLPTHRAQQLAIELKRAQQEKETQSNRIKELESKIEQYEKGGIENNVYAENLYNDAMKYRALAGYTDLVGPGILLEIHDPPVDVQYGIGCSIVDELI